VFLPAGMALSEIGRSLVLGDFEVLTGWTTMNHYVYGDDLW
jgi:hypothetical protein